MKYLIYLFIFSGAIISLEQGYANERKFTYTYETLTLPSGAREIEIWNTYRTNKGFFYRRLDQRIEFEFGITNNLMGSLYLNSSWKLQDSAGVKLNGGELANQFISISSEWKYKMLDRVADQIGLALYGETTLGLHENELEGKILLDKQFDRFLIAFNGVAEQEWKTELDEETAKTESEFSFEFDFGVSYQAMNALSMGFEVRNHNVIKDGGVEHSALFAGPALSYTASNWWATFSILPQVTSFKDETIGNLDLKEYEKVQARLLLSFHI